MRPIVLVLLVLLACSATGISAGTLSSAPAPSQSAKPAQALQPARVTPAISEPAGSVTNDELVSIQRTQMWAAVVQTIAALITLGLVVYYTRATAKMASATAGMAQETKRMAEETKRMTDLEMRRESVSYQPRITIDEGEHSGGADGWWLANIGQGNAIAITTYALDEKGMVQETTSTKKPTVEADALCPRDKIFLFKPYYEVGSIEARYQDINQNWYKTTLSYDNYDRKALNWEGPFFEKPILGHMDG